MLLPKFSTPLLHFVLTKVYTIYIINYNYKGSSIKKSQVVKVFSPRNLTFYCTCAFRKCHFTFSDSTVGASMSSFVRNSALYS